MLAYYICLRHYLYTMSDQLRAPEVYRGPTVGIGRSADKAWLDTMANGLNEAGFRGFTLQLRTDPAVNYVGARELAESTANIDSFTDPEVVSQQVSDLIGEIATEKTAQLSKASKTLNVSLVGVVLNRRIGRNRFRFTGRIKDDELYAIYTEKLAVREALGLPINQNIYPGRIPSHLLRIGFIEIDVSTEPKRLEKQLYYPMPHMVPLSAVVPVRT